MTGTLAAASPSVQALGLLVVVLVEAALLYLGYGVLEDTLGPPLFEQLKDR